MRSEFTRTLAIDQSTGSGDADSLLLTEQPGAAERSAFRIGPYKLLQMLGEGGFGSVYLAEQDQPLRRSVALKILKLGMDSRQVIARFDAERQALALMDHPHIAKVYDAGTTETGRPYFVMELVKGVPITEYCDTNQLAIRERLVLFMLVCHAVQHAHQKGIIHRDLKPSNVMIAMHDGKPAPKVIDFGIAKAIDQKLTDKTVFTELRQLMGTPEYMSPEQAEMTGIDIDTRSDIYSLGVLLYELLTGATPFDGKQLREAGYGEMQRLIREVEPARPSLRINALGEGAADVARRRQSDARSLAKLLRDDLDWIVMKCLEKDRTRRYESADALAMEILRYLCDENVTVRPPNTGYLMTKFARRHRAAVLWGGLLTLLTVIGLGASSWHAWRQSSARAEAERQRDAALDVLTQMHERTEQLMGSRHPATRALLQDIVRVHEQFGDHAQAQRWREKIK